MILAEKHSMRKASHLGIKSAFLIVLYLFTLMGLSCGLYAQSADSRITELQQSLKTAESDTIRMDIYHQIGLNFNELNIDSALLYLNKSLVIAQRLDLKIDEASIINNLGYMANKVNNYPKALEYFLQTEKIAENPENEQSVWWVADATLKRAERLEVLGYNYMTLGHLFGSIGNISKQISGYQQSLKIGKEIEDLSIIYLCYLNLAWSYYHLGKVDSALYSIKNVYDATAETGIENLKYFGGIPHLEGKILAENSETDKALKAYNLASRLLEKHQSYNQLGDLYQSKSKFYKGLNQLDSSLVYGKRAVQVFKSIEDSEGIANTYKDVAHIYRQLDEPDSAFSYLEQATSIKDSLQALEKENITAFQSVGFNETLRLKKLEDEKIQTQFQIRVYALIFGIVIVLIIALLLFRNIKTKKTANEQLQHQKNKVDQALVELKATQSQLIQAEKMASLGELTAGIAHEIQNPLNFVNNFSELNNELIDEQIEEIEKGDLEEVKDLALLMKANGEKINHHGRRADAIVKGMLAHSRTGKGEKELTDINQLADEYLRLSYHGLRAKDSTFNADFKMDLDLDLPKVNVVPQDMGRVLLNLINNAFQSVGTKHVSSNISDSTNASSDLQPTVTVSTQKMENGIQITVSDNGTGIPENIKDKIFQPFFTTKPTGQGTGLGLSLSYDIVKAHGGTLSVESTEGQGTTFTIRLKTLE